MLKFLFYLFIGYIIYSWIRLIFSAGLSKREAKSQQKASKGNYLQEKRKKMEDELSEYVDYKEVE
jgi:hypothetical protein